MRSTVWLWSVAALGACLAALFACADNPSIDGARVPTLASPTCAQACERLSRLCGYAPVGCQEDCEASFDDARRACVGQAPSCQAALESCAPEEADAGEDAGEEVDAEADGGDEDAGEDAQAADAADDVADAPSD